MKLSIVQGRNQPRDQAVVSASSRLYDQQFHSENLLDPHGFEVM